MQDLFLTVNQCLMEENMPSKKLQNLIQTGEFKEYPFHLFERQLTTEQSPIFHPEGNVWKHTLLVVDQAAKRKHHSSDAKVFMWAALLHDIGKPDTTKTRKGRITAYNHDKVGAELAKDFLEIFTNDQKFIKEVTSLVRYHMQLLYVVKNLPFKDFEGLTKNVNIQDVALLGLCDRLGRTGVEKEDEEENIRIFLHKCREYMSKTST